MPSVSYARHQSPPSEIQQSVWLYPRFTLSYRSVEELLAKRGLDVSYGMIPRWGLKFRTAFAKRLRLQRSRPSSCWHLDEMVVFIGGRRKYLRRAVDDEGDALDIPVQRRRNARAARKLMRTLLKKQGYAPSAVVTDKLRSYPAAFRDIGLSARHERGLRKNNLAESSHLPIRRRERKLQRFKSKGRAQRFLSVLAPFYNVLNILHRLMSRHTLRVFRADAAERWADDVAARPGAPSTDETRQFIDSRDSSPSPPLRANTLKEILAVGANASAVRNRFRTADARR